MSKISIYTFKLAENYSKLPPLHSFLDAVDKKTFSRISDQKRRQEFLVTRYITKRILTEAYKLQKPKFTYGIKGKPKIQGLKINWTHSENLAILAVSKTIDLGVDLEIGKRSKTIDKISKTFFSSEEYHYIFASKNERQQMLRFQKLWSLKEAFAKAIGKKLNKKTIQIYFNLNDKKVSRLPLKKSVTFFLHAKKSIAICALGSVKQIEGFSVSLRGKTLKIGPATSGDFIKLT